MSDIQQNKPQARNTPILENVPSALKALPQWVCWRYEPREGEDKWAKPPMTAVPGRAGSPRARVNGPETWSDFGTAIAYYQKYARSRGQWAEGIGFVLTPEDHLVAVDFDHCVEDGVLDATAALVIQGLNSYAEWSPSGTGVHVILQDIQGRFSGGGKFLLGGLAVEVYADSRYVTVTGHRLEGSPPTVREAALILEGLISVPPSGIAESPGGEEQEVLARVPPSPSPPCGHPELSDGDLVRRLQKPRGDLEQSFRLTREIACGTWDAASDSERDFVLARILVYGTNRDLDRCDRLFRRFPWGKKRLAKWDSPRGDTTYGRHTLRKAVEAVDRDLVQYEALAAALEQKQTGIVGTGAFLLTEEGSHDGNARCLRRLVGEEYIHCQEFGRGSRGDLGWLHYIGTHWERDYKALVRDTMLVLEKRRVAVARIPIQTAHQKTVIRNAKGSEANVRGTMSLLEAYLPGKWGDFDAAVNALNVANGMLDLRTGELGPHDRSHLFSYCVSIPYEPDADTLEWRAFLRQVLGGDKVEDIDELEEYLQIAVGYSLTGMVRQKRLFYIQGPKDAGKGVFLETLNALFRGTGLVKTRSFSTFTKRTDEGQGFDLAGLSGKTRLVFASEGRKNATFDAKFKNLTGGDEIACAHKYGAYFSYRPMFCIWLASNWLPVADAEDDAAWERFALISFPRSFTECSDITMKERFRQPAFLKGVLAWAVEGAIKYNKRGDTALVQPQSMRHARQVARTLVDEVGRWVEECVEFVEGGFVTSSEIYESYLAWCEAEDIRSPKSQNLLGRALTSRHGLVRGRRSVEGDPSRGYVGVRLTEGFVGAAGRIAGTIGGPGD